MTHEYKRSVRGQLYRYFSDVQGSTTIVGMSVMLAFVVVIVLALASTIGTHVHDDLVVLRNEVAPNAVAPSADDPPNDNSSASDPGSPNPLPGDNDSDEPSDDNNPDPGEEEPSEPSGGGGCSGQLTPDGSPQHCNVKGGNNN